MNSAPNHSQSGADVQSAIRASNAVGEVLVVDDDRVYLDVIARALQRHGIRARTCTSWSEAIQYVMDRSIKTVVSDYFMPDYDGLSMLREAQRLRPDCRTVLMSAQPIGHRNFGRTPEFADKISVVDRIVSGTRPTRPARGGKHESA